MRKKLRSHLTFANVASATALFVALGGTGAYAANEWTGANIQDESLTGADVKGKAQTSSVAAVNGSLTGYDVAGQPAIPALNQPFIDGSLTTWDINDASLAGRDVQDGSLTTSDIFDGTLAGRDVQDGSLAGGDIADGSVAGRDVQDGSLAGGDIADGSVAGRDVQDNSLRGEDIDESTLAPVPSSNPNADRLDGLDSTAFRQFIRTSRESTHRCVVPNTWVGCAGWPVTVPAGRTYIVTVKSSVNAFSPTTQVGFLCAARDGPTCADFTGNPEAVTFWGGAYTTGVSSYTWTVEGPHTFTAQTALNFPANVSNSFNAKTTTEVHIYDARMDGLAP